jgi:hypothetical protein
MLNINKSILEKMYKKERMTKVEIAQKLGCCVQTVNKYIKKYNIPNQRNKKLKDYDIGGERFGRLVAKKFYGMDSFSKQRWLCQCDCGKEHICNASSLLKGLTKSCGCYKREVLFKGCGQITRAYWRKIERSSQNRNKDLLFEITIEEAWEIALKQDLKCAISGVPIRFASNYDKYWLQTASPDRINSSLHYTADNFQWVHKRVNRMKNELSVKELLFWVDKIHKNNENEEIEKYDVDKLSW